MPHSKEAEQGVLGVILQDNAALPRIEGVLEARHFFSLAHQEIYGQILQMLGEGQPVDELTLGQALEGTERLEAVGGMAYLLELRDRVPRQANVLTYAEIVKEKFFLRQLIESSLQLAESGQRTEGKNAETLIQEAEQHFLNLSSEVHQQSYAPLETLLLEEMKALEHATATPEMPTGFTELDSLTHGLHRGELAILAARPGMGKTALALSICRYVAEFSAKPVLIFSLEMSAQQLTQRLLSMEARVNSRSMRRNQLGEAEWEALGHATNRLVRMPIFIDDTTDLTPTRLRGTARRIHQAQEGGLGLVVVDYLQLMHIGRRIDSREQEIAEISRTLKGLARELKVCVLALAQLNRAPTRRADSRPMLHDLRESGSLEQDADLVLFIYRDKLVNKDSDDEAELHIAKHRNGPVTGADGVRLLFTEEFALFGNLSHREIDQGYQAPHDV